MGWYTILAAVLLTAFAILQAVTPHRMPDFYIFRLGSALAARGENPYDVPKIRSHVAQEFPEENPTPESFVNNCGYFLPPQATVLFLPFAMLPLAVAKIVWALIQGLAGLAIATVPQLVTSTLTQEVLVRRRNELPLSPLIAKLLPFLMLLNFLTVAVVMVGQFSVVFVGCIVAGLWCFARADRWAAWLGVLLWSVAFVKPHVALPLIPLAWYLGGWKRAAALVAVVGAFNLLGATIVGGSPLFLRDYFAYLGANHRAVMYNQAELAAEMTSWNRLLYVATASFAGSRYLIEQSAKIVVASYLVWFGLILGRCGIFGVRPSAAWVLAACAAGMVLCPQVLGYETLVLLLAVPWIRDLFSAGYRAWGLVAVLLLGLQWLPYQGLEPIGFTIHRPLGVALFALFVLIAPSRPLDDASDSLV